jgi:arylsulfatase A-like enzyme
LSGNRADPVDAKNRRGWDFWAVRNCSHQHSKPEYWLNDSKDKISVPGWEPEVQTDLAIEYIKKNRQAPFCLFLSYGPPHNPYKAPKKYMDMYKGKSLKARPNVPGGTTENLLEYYAMITSIDVGVGRIREALDKAGIAEDTILIFTSDHGDMLGSQGQPLKQRPWEESIHIPFILRYPCKVAKNLRRDWILSSVDVMPTLLGLGGIPIPSQVQGMDYSATFFGQSGKERDASFLFNIHSGAGPKTDWRGIRTKEWIYAYHFAGDWVMYDLKNDPYQLKNLINDPAYAAKKSELHGQLEAMRKDLGESIPLKGKMPDPICLPG